MDISKPEQCKENSQEIPVSAWFNESFGNGKPIAFIKTRWWLNGLMNGSAKSM